MSSPAASRRKGAAAETEALRMLLAAGHQAERIRLAGVNDEGDLHVYKPNGTLHVYEVKNVTDLSIPGALRELAREVENVRRTRPGVPVTGSLLIRHRGGMWSEVVPWTLEAK